MFKLVVLSVALAVASAKPSGVWGGLISPWNAAIAAPLAAPLAAPILTAPLGAIAPIGISNYRGPLSLAPGQPANILAADGRPLDTLSVNLDRAAHLTAKGIEGSSHLLKKRSIVGTPVVAAPLAVSHLVSGSLALSPLAASNLAAASLATNNLAAAQLAGAGLIAGPLAPRSIILSQSAPLTIASPIAPLGLGHVAGLGQLW
ncbi:non-reducing polyketide synthase stbA-like [Maniola jurtina]|uniref:non-reducing polyketide synthase stbA-like n=1 Tax=Maniola jurtina TaxID=191418 RepID=UPI001E68D8D3|nr:non-reducing polyketide synthase stbA-like [Maniola jurtina]